MERVVEMPRDSGFSIAGPSASTTPRKRQVRFSARHDIMLLREVVAQNPFKAKETTRSWGRVGEIISAALQDESFEVDARRCRERTMLLLDYYKKQDFPSLRRFGTERLYAQKEDLLQVVLELEAEKVLGKEESKYHDDELLRRRVLGKEESKYHDEELRRRVLEELSMQEEQEKPDLLSATAPPTVVTTPEPPGEEAVGVSGRHGHLISGVQELVDDDDDDGDDDGDNCGLPELLLPGGGGGGGALALAPTAKRACQCCCQTYAEILSFLEKRAEAETRLREEEMALRREELELEREKIGLERERLAAERREREQRFELESQERQVILDLLREKVLPPRRDNPPEQSTRNHPEQPTRNHPEQPLRNHPEQLTRNHPEQQQPLRNPPESQMNPEQQLRNPPEQPQNNPSEQQQQPPPAQPQPQVRGKDAEG
ncbi:trichohyalin [Engraulis encrasicolus]|uniref:trichohyalin n=1 Tax=Engraulis encrasicolus TaxID=184585 RepID=UPI002FCF59A7